jgi:hypothetical protein
MHFTNLKCLPEPAASLTNALDYFSGTTMTKKSKNINTRGLYNKTFQGRKKLSGVLTSVSLIVSHFSLAN